MKNLKLTIITSFWLLTVLGQNGLNRGDLFLLLKDQNSIDFLNFGMSYTFKR
jgi:hypothetical protein